MIYHSNSIHTIGLGYAMLMAFHETYGKTDLFETVKAQQNLYKAQLMCLSKASYSANFMADFLDPEYQRISLLAINEYDRTQQVANFIDNK